MTIGFTCGAFDLTHAGHYIMFEECKKQCDYLIVGLHVDPTQKLFDKPEEKNKPVQSMLERFIQLSSCKFIDEIIPYETEEDIISIFFWRKPNIRFMGADWVAKSNYSRDRLKDLQPETKVIYNSRGHSFSSSSLRRRVKNATA